MISIFCSAVKCYGFTESRKHQLRKLVEKGKSGKYVMVGLSVFLYHSSDNVCVCV